MYSSTTKTKGEYISLNSLPNDSLTNDDEIILSMLNGTHIKIKIAAIIEYFTILLKFVSLIGINTIRGIIYGNMYVG